MIVTEQMAREAAGDLGLTLHDTLDETTVSMAYRALAKTVHPDVGGSAEAFAAVDRAKHVLMEWLKRKATTTIARAHGKRPCTHCEGRGYIVLTSGRPGSMGLRRQCQRCHGSGDADYDNHGLHS